MTGPKVSKKRWFGLPPKRVPCLLTMVFDICRSDRVLWSFMCMTPQTMQERSWSERDQKASVKPTVKRAERTINHVSRSTYVKWHLSIIFYYYINYRNHHKIHLYIIRYFCKKKHMNGLSAFFAHPHSKTKNPWVFAEVLGGRQLLRVWLRFRLLGQWGGHTSHREWVLKVTKMGQRYVFFVGDLRWFLMIWNDFRIFEVIS